MSNETRRIVTVLTVNITTYELDTADGITVDARTAADLFHEHIGSLMEEDECTHTVISDEPYNPACWAKMKAKA